MTGRGPGARVRELEDSLPSLREAFSSLTSTDPLLLVPRLSLIVALPLFETASLQVLTVAAIATAVVLLTPALLRLGWIFVGVAASRFVWQIGFWELVDNHEWLITWWTLAVGCCLLTSDPRRSLVRAATLLIGLTFAFATFWKFAGGAFADGRFFEFMLLTDSRLENFAERFSGMEDSAVATARENFENLQYGTGPPEATALESSSGLRGVALVMSWWGVAIEAALAVLFLMPNRARWVPAARVAAIVAFCVTTYLLLPVIYFAGVLLVMAIAASPRRFTKPLLITLAAVILWTGYLAMWGLPL